MGVSSSDLRGVGKLTIDAAVGLTGLVEAMHHNIAHAPGVLGPPPQGPIGGITGWIYRGIRDAAQMAGGGLDILLAQLTPALGEQTSSPARDNFSLSCCVSLRRHALPS
jgi:hypothetical protein